MKLSFSLLRSALFAFLLVLVGGMAEFRYHPIERFMTQRGGSQIVGQSGLDLPGLDLSLTAPSNKNEIDLSTFWQVWAALENNYLEPDKINQQDMVNGAIQGMTASLGDPYTMYLPPVENERSGQDLAGAFYGVGIELGYREGILAVVAPLDGTPAAGAGVEAGDLILRVKDESKDLDSDTTGWSLNEAVDNIRGPKGSPVTLTLLREDTDGQPFDVTINRGEIVVESVELTFVEHAGKRVAHMRVSRFGERTPQEWEVAVNQVLAERSRIDGIVLDFRNNPGGFFDGAIDLASDFIEDGVVVTQKGKYRTQDFQAQGVARLAGIPLEVLVNKGSASASEIVAGALRDQLGAQLVGQQTFGKGTVQDRQMLPNGGGLHVTIARWMLPKGDWIHDEGIPVDIEVENNPETEEDEMLHRAIEVL